MLFRLNSKLEGGKYMEKGKKEMQERNKHLEEWVDKGNFDDWVNLGLEYDYLENGTVPPFTDSYKEISSRMIPGQYLGKCWSDENCILVKVIGIHWKLFDFSRNCNKDDYNSYEAYFPEAAMVQINLKHINEDILPNIIWKTLCNAYIGPWSPDYFEYLILNKKSSEPIKVICATDYVYDKQLVNATYTGWKDCICEIRKNGQNLFSSQWFKLGVKENIVATIIAPYDE